MWTTWWRRFSRSGPVARASGDTDSSSRRRCFAILPPGLRRSVPDVTLQSLVGFTGPDRVLQVCGVKLVGLTEETGRKLLLVAGVIIALTLVNQLVSQLVRRVYRKEAHLATRFWWLQAVRLITLGLGIILLVSICFHDPQRLATVAGLVSAGLAI